MRGYICILPILLICFLGCNQLSKDRFILNGEVENAGAEYVVLSYWRISERLYVNDTAIIANGVFSIADTLCEPTLAKLQIGDTILSFYIEPSKVMTLNFSRSNPEETYLVDSDTDKEHFELKNEIRPHTELLDNAKFAAMKIRESIETTSDKESPMYKELKEKEKKINREMDSLSNIILKTEIKFINTNPESFISAHITDRLIFDGKINLDKQKEIYNKFPDFIKESHAGKEILEKIQCQQNISEKGTAPDFSINDINGNSLTLSSFRGKSYVLLDFWASWCMPCFESMPLLKEAYSRYHEKGFDIISISNEENEEEWKAAIEENELGNWHHIINKDYMNPFADNESIQGKYRKARLIVPVYILIDKNGRVVKKWEGFSDEIKQNMEAALEKIFNE